MAKIITMPRLSDTMTEGTVALWNKKIGDSVESGDVLAEIETDKATMEFEVFEEGTLLHIGVNEGKTAPVDSILAIVGEKGEKIDDLLKSHTTPEVPMEEPQIKEEVPLPQEPSREIQEVPPIQAKKEKNDGRIKVSPLARKMAEEKNISLENLSGTGDGGRVVKKDIDAFLNTKPTTSFTAQSTEPEKVSVSQMRKTIAGRLSQSKFTAPHFYLTSEINMSELVAAREKLKQAVEKAPSINDFIIKAVALSLREHPYINASWGEKEMILHKDINIGVAVAIDDGLLVPVIRNADLLPLQEIGKKVRELAGKAKERKLDPKEWEGNTFTISNLGMFGIDEFTAIINQPDSCILAVGGIKEVPVVKGGEIVPGSVMKVTMSCDHRVVDGVVGAKFLQTLKNGLENPLLMI